MIRRTLILLTTIAISTALGFSGGSGTPLDPYQIATPADLAEVNDYLSASYIMTADIDLSAITYDKAVIAHSSQFRGTFDGNGYKITGLKITTNNNNTGLIGQTSGAIIANLGIEQAVMSAGTKENIAVLCGYSFNGTSILNCYVTGTVSGGSSVGGLVGYNQTSSVENCYSLCNINGSSKGSRVGGLIGYNFNNSPVDNCYATGTVSGNNEVGGLIGKNQTTTVSNCYATGAVSGAKSIGGLLGYNQAGETTNCYATGNITGEENSGGLCGYNWEGSFTTCYAEGNVQGEDYNGGFIGYNIKGDITECYASGTVSGIGNSEYSGGFTGRNDTGTISYCYATGNVTGKTYNGGFTGYNNSGLITICFAEGSVVGSGEYNGGFVGLLNAGPINNCFAYGDVTGLSNTAGFCGRINTAGGSISNSYCSGYIDGTGEYIGCFLGVTWSGSLSNCFWDVETSGLGCTGFNGATGKTTAQMQDQNTFTDVNWNFVDIWVMPAAGYPQHKWLNIEIPMLGTGTKNDPYQIATQEHLEQVNKDLTAYYILVDDIDLTGTNYTTAIIAPDTDNSTYTHEGGPFVGSFDGNGFVISGIAIDTLGQSNNYLGLFGYISMGSVKNVVLEGVSITAAGNSRYVGALSGYNSSTVVTDCSSTGSITTGDNSSFYGGLIGRNGADVTGSFSTVQITAGERSMYVGGLIGYNYMTGKIVNCYADGDVYADANSESVGGLVGRNWFGIISDSYSTAHVETAGGTLYLGSFCGYNSGTITGSYATNHILTAGTYVGGFCGYNYYGTLINCYSQGRATGYDYVGGLCGTSFKGFVMDCYTTGRVYCDLTAGGLYASQSLTMTLSCFWDTEATALAVSAGGFGKTTAEMQDMSTYLAVGWDFVNYWAIEANQYPTLIYPNIPIPNKPAKFSGGNGTLGNPYQIGSVADWQELMNTSAVWNKYFIVIKNIDLKDVDLTTVGNETTSFTGSFDGAGYKISNASMISAYDKQALFGVVNGASFSNVALENVTIAGGQMIAALAGTASNSSFTNCSATGIIAGQASESGALIAVCENGSTITECYTNIMIQGDGKCVGGLVGRLNNSTVTKSFSLGDTFGNGDEMGGLVGRVENNGLVSKSYAVGEVTGGGTTYRAGGLVGYNYNSTIEDCFSTGQVSGFDAIGGLVGQSDNAAITNCYTATKVSTNNAGIIGGLLGVDNGSTVTESFWDTEVSGLDTSAAGKGYVTSVMQDIDTYLSAGWDFANIWWIPAADYPKMQTEMKGAGTQTNPYQVENQFHLERINDNLVKTHYILMADIDLSTTTYSTAIIAPDGDSGTSGFEGISFSGIFDGNGHKITGLNIDTNGEKKYYVGLFGRVNDGTIKNLALENININVGDNSWYIGGIAGWNNSVMLTNCYTTGQITTGQYSETMGGLVGENRGTITSCYSEVTMNTGQGAKFIGGLVGWNGMVGGSPKPGVISNCYAKGIVNGTAGAYSNPWSYGGSGGLVGANWYGLISDSYSLTQLSNAQVIGGLCGYSNNGTISGCFWDIETTGIASSNGGTGLTTAQMIDNDTFASAGWNFATAWMQIAGQYPTLIFEGSLFPKEAKPLNATNIDTIMFIAENWLSPVGDTTIDLNQNTDEDLVDMKIFTALNGQMNDD